MLGLIVIVITFLLAVGATLLALKLPLEFQIWKFITGAIAIGLLLSVILYWQQMREVARAPQDRDNAITQASNRAIDETTQRLTQEIGKKYEQQVQSLTKQVADLQAQLPNQGSKLDAMGGGNADAGNTSSAGGSNSASASLFWIQSDEKVGRGSAEIQFRVYGLLNTPAFIAVCEHPCKAVGGQAGAGSEGIPLVGSADKEVAGFLFKKPKPMPAGTEGTITLQSLDREPVRVASFRILHESEVPAGLK